MTGRVSGLVFALIVFLTGCGGAGAGSGTKASDSAPVQSGEKLLFNVNSVREFTPIPAHYGDFLSLRYSHDSEVIVDVETKQVGPQLQIRPKEGWIIGSQYTYFVKTPSGSQVGYTLVVNQNKVIGGPPSPPDFTVREFFVFPARGESIVPDGAIYYVVPDRVRSAPKTLLIDGGTVQGTTDRYNFGWAFYPNQPLHPGSHEAVLTAGVEKYRFNFQVAEGVVRLLQAPITSMVVYSHSIVIGGLTDLNTSVDVVSGNYQHRLMRKFAPAGFAEQGNEYRLVMVNVGGETWVDEIVVNLTRPSGHKEAWIFGSSSNRLSDYRN